MSHAKDSTQPHELCSHNSTAKFWLKSQHGSLSFCHKYQTKTHDWLYYVMYDMYLNSCNAFNFGLVLSVTHYCRKVSIFMAINS